MQPSTDLLAEFDRYRNLLFSIAYRMLGSIADAEDILQEAFLRWYGAVDAEIESPRAFLVTIVSRLCINQLQSARARREEYIGQWLPEPIVTAPDPAEQAISSVDASLSMAFLVLLERLSPVERAVFLLREVFDYEYGELASVVGKDETNCRQILSRARRHMAEVRPRFQVSPERRQELLTRFLQATATGNLETLVAVLSNDVVLHSDGGGKAPAVLNLVHGADAVARAILGSRKKFVPEGLTHRITQINGEPGLVSFRDGRPFSVLTVDGDGQRVSTVYIVTNPEKLTHFTSLPAPC